MGAYSRFFDVAKQRTLRASGNELYVTVVVFWRQLRRPGEFWGRCSFDNLLCECHCWNIVSCHLKEPAENNDFVQTVIQLHKAIDEADIAATA